MADRKKSPWAEYEIRDGKDGKPGIYTRDYNCRLAIFNANTYALQQALKKLFDGAHKRLQKPAKPKRRSPPGTVNPKARIGEKGYYAGPPMPTRP